MGVIMQTFYWDCPILENKEFKWWKFIEEKIPGLKDAGFTALWLPPISKAANIGGPSMGYDPYDYYDLGNINQKGRKATWFGSKNDLIKLINSAHLNGLQVYADLVLNHNSGADAIEMNEIDNTERWTSFNPKSGKFSRDWKCFHPSPYEIWDDYVFGNLPDLCHRNPYVYSQLIEYARWLLEEIGFDGFRYDCVKGYGGWMVRAIQELRTVKNGHSIKPFGVGECWDSNRNIKDWLAESNAWSDNPVSAFDFALRDILKNLCDGSEFNMHNLQATDTLLKDAPEEAVTFVENHDIVRDNPVINDKMLAYAFILTHEGYPCVFWQDYYNWNLALDDTKSGIAALVKIHEYYAGGRSTILHIDNNLYIMQRYGYEKNSGLVLVMNNKENDWNGATVKTHWINKKFTPQAWRGKNDIGVPDDEWSNNEGRADFWAPPRGYTVYVPDN